jgi:hypothetical protein
MPLGVLQQGVDGFGQGVHSVEQRPKLIAAGVYQKGELGDRLVDLRFEVPMVRSSLIYEKSAPVLPPGRGLKRG